LKLCRRISLRQSQTFTAATATAVEAGDKLTAAKRECKSLQDKLVASEKQRAAAVSELNRLQRTLDRNVASDIASNPALLIASSQFPSAAEVCQRYNKLMTELRPDLLSELEKHFGTSWDEATACRLLIEALAQCRSVSNQSWSDFVSRLGRSLQGDAALFDAAMPAVPPPAVLGAAIVHLRERHVAAVGSGRGHCWNVDMVVHE
jgi:hypothetical protein